MVAVSASGSTQISGPAKSQTSSRRPTRSSNRRVYPKRRRTTPLHATAVNFRTDLRSPKRRSKRGPTDQLGDIARAENWRNRVRACSFLGHHGRVRGPFPLRASILRHSPFRGCPSTRHRYLPHLRYICGFSQPSFDEAERALAEARRSDGNRRKPHHFRGLRCGLTSNDC